MPREERRRPRDVKYRDAERFNYLQKLKNEFETSKSIDAKRQTIANLANFAYNPENFEHLYNIDIHQVFANNIDATDAFVSLSSLKGLCNLASFPPCVMFFEQSEFLDKVVNSAKNRADSVDFITNTLLLIITLKQSNITLDWQLLLRLRRVIDQLPETTKSDTQLNNLCKILFNNIQKVS